VMKAGRIEQVASPQELRDRPANAFVAGFIAAASTSLAATMDQARLNRTFSEGRQ
jgi:ABC-type sugar transport system ATPase subunit